MARHAAVLGLLLCALIVGPASAGPEREAQKAGGDWTRFGYDAMRSNSGPAATGITAATVRRLARQQVQLDGTVDSSPIYLPGVKSQDVV